MVKVNWTPQSIEDVNNIAEYIAKDSAHFAEIQVAHFFDYAAILETKLLLVALFRNLVREQSVKLS